MTTRQRGVAAVAGLALLLCAVGAVGGWLVGGRLRGDFRPRQTWSPPETATAVAATRGTPTAGSARTAIRQATVQPATRTPPPAAGQLPPPPRATPSVSAVLPSPAFPSTALAPSPTPTVSPSPSPSPTALAAGDWAFALAGPLRHSTGDCPGVYILGRVVDAAGNPLTGVRLWLVDEWGNESTAQVKTAPGEAGRYDFPLFGPPRRYFLSVVDASGHPISPRIEIRHGLDANSQAACHWADWQRR